MVRPAHRAIREPLAPQARRETKAYRATPAQPERLGLKERLARLARKVLREPQVLPVPRALRAQPALPAQLEPQVPRGRKAFKEKRDHLEQPALREHREPQGPLAQPARPALREPRVPLAQPGRRVSRSSKAI